MKKTLKIFIISNVSAIFCVVFFLIAFILFNGWDCQIAKILHIYCPGCGGTRALIYLLKGDIISSIRYNISVIFGVIVLAYYDIRLIIGIIKKDNKCLDKINAIPMYIFVGVLLGNFVLRNILLWGFQIDIIGDIIK